MTKGPTNGRQPKWLVRIIDGQMPKSILALMPVVYSIVENKSAAYDLSHYFL
jgi:hypothetical protein